MVGINGLTSYNCTFRLACVLARHPRSHKHGDPIVASEVHRDPARIDDPPVLCAYHALGRSGGKHHSLGYVRAMGRPISRADCRVSDKDVPRAPPHSVREGIQACRWPVECIYSVLHIRTVLGLV